MRKLNLIRFANRGVKGIKRGLKPISMSSHYFVLLALLTFGFLVAPFSPLALKTEQASAGHDCGVWLFEGYTFNWYEPYANDVLKFCYHGVDNYSLSTLGLNKNVSSIAVTLPNQCSQVLLRDEHGNAFGGPSGLVGPGRWEIASLAPYGWDNKITGTMTIIRWC